MNAKFNSTSVQILLILLLTIPLPTLAKQKAVYGEFAVDSTKCISEEVFIHARTSGNSSNAKVTFSIYRQDICLDEPLLMLKADKVKLKKGSLEVADDLSQASLNGTIAVVEKLTKRRYKVRLSLNWNADEELILSDTDRDMTKTRSDEEGHSKTDNYKIAYRDASARGTIEVNGDLLSYDTTRGASLVSTDIKKLNVK